MFLLDEMSHRLIARTMRSRTKDLTMIFSPPSFLLWSLSAISWLLEAILTSQVDEQSKPLARHLPCGREHRLRCKTPAKCTCALSLFSDQFQVKTKRTSMPSLYESRRKANSSTNSRVISLCRSSGTCRRGLSCCCWLSRWWWRGDIGDDVDDANDEDLRNVAQKSHHVAEQVGLLREPLLTLRSELFTSEGQDWKNTRWGRRRRW